MVGEGQGGDKTANPGENSSRIRIMNAKCSGGSFINIRMEIKLEKRQLGMDFGDCFFSFSRLPFKDKSKH